MTNNTKQSKAKKLNNIRYYCFLVTLEQREIIEQAVNHFLKVHFNGDESKKGRCFELMCANYLSEIND